MKQLEDILKKLKTLSSPKNVEGMARFGISPKNTLGVSVPHLRKLAKEIGKSHQLALDLWGSGFHEARILAGMIDEIDQVTEKQMDGWAKDFDSWDVCDQVMMNLFDQSPIAFQKAKKWTKAEQEFVKRAGFALMACLAWHRKDAPDQQFIDLFPSIVKGSTDERNFVKKAVNWALRQIGKRNESLRKEAIKVALKIQKIESRSAKWIAADALRELEKYKFKK